MTLSGTYELRRLQAGTLEDRVLEIIHEWHAHGTYDDGVIDELFVAVAQFQLEYNAPYRRYLERIGRDDIASFADITPVPTSAFKHARLATFSDDEIMARFLTSGTTTSERGEHVFASTRVYDAAALAIFDRFVLRRFTNDTQAKFRFVCLVPNIRVTPTSSLGYMAMLFARARGNGEAAFAISNDAIDHTAMLAAIASARADGVPVLLLATAFAMMHVLDIVDGSSVLPTGSLALPAGSIVIETGGLKGRSKQIARETLYAMISERFKVPQSHILAEFGMTELTSQYYDDLERLSIDSGSISTTSHPDDRAMHASDEIRVKVGPPWLRARICDADGNDVEPGTVGALRHFDLANVGSVCAIETEDLAVRRADDARGFVLLGRDANAELRGCSLDAETLRTAARN